MTDGSAPVEALGLTKRYGERLAVDGVDLTVGAGDVYGYLGPNGAGKTTSLRMLLGLIRPTAGESRLFGRDPLVDGARALDGVAGFVEAPRFYPYLTARKNLELCAAYDGDGARSRIDEALDTVELSDRAKDRVGGYSHGMKQRLGIAAALLRNPRLLLLDEPTTGLDPAGMRDMRDLVRRLSGEGMTVLLSSHLMAEVEELCNRVAIIQSGRILYEGALRELLASAGSSRRLAASDPVRAAEIAQRMGLHPQADGAYIELGGDDQDVLAYTVELGRAGIGILELTTGRASLEHLFFELTENGGAATHDETPEPVGAAV
jgi:ABC-2 type transport system ATP-binding protein